MKAARTPSQAPNRQANPGLPSPEELMNQYAALVWKTAAAYLENPEDIKECVNDTFLEFYLHSDRYDPGKGSYAAFLCAITRNKAVSLYRKNRKHVQNVSLSGEDGDGSVSASFPKGTASLAGTAAEYSDPAETAADRLDLEAALSSLDPEEFDLIRMKYYDGMTIKEIADSMNLPYETVKKRHQRTLTKLQKALAISLLLALLAALAACAYVALRYFGVVPGYGVNENADISVYQLDEVLSNEGDDPYGTELYRCSYMNDILMVEFSFTPRDADNEPFTPSLTQFHYYYKGADGSEKQQNPGAIADLSHPDGTAGFQVEAYWPELGELLKTEAESSLRVEMQIVQLLFEPIEMPDGSLEYRDQIGENHYSRTISFTLQPLAEDNLENYSYEMTEGGGLLVIPSIQNGELVADIYPLNPENGTIDPQLIDSGYLSGEEQEYITATAEDGTVLTGTCMNYMQIFRPSYYTWNFGPAEPGNYTLHVPYLLKEYINLSPDDIWIPLHLEDGYTDETVYEIPGGTLTLGPIEQTEPPENAESTEIYSSLGSWYHLAETGEIYTYDDVYGDCQNWLIPVNVQLDRPDEHPLYITFFAEFQDIEDDWYAPRRSLSFLGTSGDDTLLYLLRIPETTHTLSLRLKGITFTGPVGDTSEIGSRWEHSFSIPFTAEEAVTTPEHTEESSS